MKHAHKTKVSIYSGAIPSTTFIENLIERIAEDYEIVLFGKSRTKKKYGNKNIKVRKLSRSKMLFLVQVCSRVVLLALIYPQRLKTLISQIKKVEGFYPRYRWLGRYVNVLLELPDIFHLQWPKEIDKWFFLKEEYNIAFLVSLRGSQVNIDPFNTVGLADSYKEYFPKVDGFHAVSKAISREAINYGAREERIKVIHSPVMNSTFEHFSEELKISSDKFRIVSIGRQHWVKGYQDAIDSMALMRDAGIVFEYHIVADNFEVPEHILFQIHDLNLQNHVHFKSAIPQNDLFRLMKEYDVQLLPSLSEGIANVVLESMAIGLPVVSTRCGGMEEVISDNVNGWLVPVGDVDQMSKVLIMVSQLSKEEINRIRTNANSTIREEFQEEKCFKIFKKWYSNMNI